MASSSSYSSLYLHSLPKVTLLVNPLFQSVLASDSILFPLEFERLLPGRANGRTGFWVGPFQAAGCLLLRWCFFRKVRDFRRSELHQREARGVGFTRSHRQLLGFLTLKCSRLLPPSCPLAHSLSSLSVTHLKF